MAVLFGSSVAVLLSWYVLLIVICNVNCDVQKGLVNVLVVGPNSECLHQEASSEEGAEARQTEGADTHVL